MKRFIVVMGIAVMAFAACSKDTIKESRPGTPINFRTIVNNGTRAQEVTNYNLEYFYATALSGYTDGSVESAEDFFFIDVPFTRIGDYFYSYPTYYWPEDNRIMAFVAHYPSMEELGATHKYYLERTYDEDNQEETTLRWNIYNFEPAKDIKDQVDFVTGFTLGYKDFAITDGVLMYLAHPLSQIAVKAFSNNSNYTYKVSGIRIAVTKSKADLIFDSLPCYFDFSYKSNEITVYEDTYDTPVTLESWSKNIMNYESGNAILLPQPLTAWDPENDPTNQQKGSYISVKLQITDKDGTQVFPATGEYGWAAIPIGGNWEQNNRYNYTLDFTNGAGYIDPTEAVNPGKNVFGDKIILTSKLGAWEDKVTVEATNSDLIGHWIGLKGNYIDSDDQIEHKYETAEEVEDWLGEFYDFVVPDDHTIKIKNASGEYNTPTTFNVVNNEVLMDCFRVGDSYQLKPYIQYIDETSAIIVNTYVYSTYTRVQTIYYKKSPLE